MNVRLASAAATLWLLAFGEQDLIGVQPYLSDQFGPFPLIFSLMCLLHQTG